MSSLKAAVVGATGLAGQQFLNALVDHPVFEVTHLAASERSAGKTFADALRVADGSSRWFAAGEPPHTELVISDARKLDAREVDVVFTAIESDAAREIEPLYAKYRPVISTASAFRYEDDVPILLPAINPEQVSMLENQKSGRGWEGFVAPGPNCTTIGLVHSLAPLVKAFGIRSVTMTSMQSISGAGRSPGVIGLDIIDNIIPYIPKEEGKVAKETRKVFGVDASDMHVDCLCTRVPVLEGHTEAVFVTTEKKVTEASVYEAFESFGKGRDDLHLHSAPERWIVAHRDPFRPQPRLDRDNDGGMATTVGRVTVTSDHTLKYVLVSHNTQMGAAKGGVLTAEWLHAKGYIG